MIWNTDNESCEKYDVKKYGTNIEGIGRKRSEKLQRMAQEVDFFRPLDVLVSGRSAAD